MLDSGILKDLIEQYKTQNTLMITLAVFIGVNIIVALFNLYTQWKLKKMDTDNHRSNIREEKRLQIMEKLYKKLDNLRSVFNNQTLLQTELASTFDLLNESTLFLKKNDIEITQNYCDYFSTLLVDPRKKDVRIESEYLEKFKREFHK